MSTLVPVARTPVSVRPATLGDIPFMDGLQSQYPRQLGHFSTSWFEGYIKTDGILVAGSDGRRVGYVISRDRYQKRDELGVIFQLCVAPGEQRKLVGAALIKAVFERSAYGCKLYCCWCAQDIDANYFWESVGFVPVAFRAGSRTKGRVHIFWQRRIHEGDEATPYWYPCQTNAGAMGEGRLVFPIPPGTHWKDVQAVAVPEEERPEISDQRSEKTPQTNAQLAGHRGAVGNRNSQPATPFRSPVSRNTGLRFIEPGPGAAAKEKKPREKKQPRAKVRVKIDPKLARAARELRDRALEYVNSGQFELTSAAKYDVSRQLSAAPAAGPIKQLPRAA